MKLILWLFLSFICLSLRVSGQSPATTVPPAYCQRTFDRWKLKLNKNLTMSSRLMIPKVSIDTAIVFCRSLFVQWKVKWLTKVYSSDHRNIIYISQLEFNKTFTSFKDDQTALSHFIVDYDKADRHNIKFEKGQASFKIRCNSRSELGLNEKRTYMSGFALPLEEDRLNEEVLKKAIPTPTVTGRAAPEPQPTFKTAPASLDYRNYGYVTEVVDQG